MGRRQDKGWGWEMRTKSTQSCFGAHPEHKCTNSKTLFFFSSQIYSLPSPSPAKQPRDGKQETALQKEHQPCRREKRVGPLPGLNPGKGPRSASKKIRHSLITQSEISDGQPQGQHSVGTTRPPSQWSHRGREEGVEPHNPPA